ncbi:polysaccharide biosynthesis protein, partial [Candidatus Acetothermia bacterium]|nr:polysaccharide biosynthesis protein [Candidatus Acetothermia bacterium]
LGSRGSVIPIFQDQIQRKGPVTVTHEDMSRYFMAISEATLLVLQAGAMGQGGEIFVLDMGTPVKIVDLAREMIRLSGYEPDKDIPIVFTGKRPGEKFFEELLMTGEGTVATQHEKIYVAKTSFQISDEHLREQLKCIKVLADQNAKEEIVQLFQELVPTYKPSQPFPQNRR